MKVVFDKYGKNDTKFIITSSSSLKNGRGIFAYANLASFSYNLSSLTDGQYMFAKCPSLTTFYSDLSSLTDGFYMFGDCDELESFYSDSSGSSVNLSALTDGDYMFYNCTSLTSFICPSLSENVVVGESDEGNTAYAMFYNCTSLTSFESDLSKFSDGRYMFYNCTSLSEFSLSEFKDMNDSSYKNMFDLSKLTNGYAMFYNCINYEGQFTAYMPYLIDGRYMFYNCKNLEEIRTSYTTESGGQYLVFGNLVYGSYMFMGCDMLLYSLNQDGTSDYIPYIDMDLIKLEDGSYMFNNCSNVVFSGGSSLGVLKNGDHMFANCNYRGQWSDILTTKQSTYKLPKLVNGNYMFYNTSIRTINFATNFTDLKCGYNMFAGSWLTGDSIGEIKNNINDLSNYSLTNDDQWKYEVNGVTYTIEDWQRGLLVLGFKGDWNNNDDKSSGWKARKYASEISKKGWDVWLYDDDDINNGWRWYKDGDDYQTSNNGELTFDEAWQLYLSERASLKKNNSL